MFSFQGAAKAGKQLTISDLSAAIAAGELVLIDVREIAEAQTTGLAEGARLIPLSLLPLKADPGKPGCELPQGVPVAIYCAAGARAGRAAEILAGFGYPEVANLGGLSNWAGGGGRVVQFKG